MSTPSSSPLPRALLGAAAVILIAGGFMHASGYGRVAAVVAASSLPPVFGAVFKALWLADFTTLVSTGLVAGLLAFRPAVAAAPVTGLLALIPGATAVFTYHFLGPFLPAHLMIAAAGLMALAAWLRGRPSARSG